MLARLAVIAAIGVGCGGSKQAFIGPQLESISRIVDLHYRATPVSLENGIVAFLLPDPGTTLVQVDARYRVGADADTVPGVAHLAEHLSYGGRAAAGAPTLAQRLDRVAIAYNAFTSWEATHYFAVAPPEAIGELLTVEADRLARPCGGIDPQAFALELDVVRNEIRSRPADIEARFARRSIRRGIAAGSRWPVARIGSDRSSSIRSASSCAGIMPAADWSW